ncbi:hypothetical protein QYF36_026011 [Acer negundo]|nr:hypothetical protein QYF36_026011 [Acer negundo]
MNNLFKNSLSRIIRFNRHYPTQASRGVHSSLWRRFVAGVKEINGGSSPLFAELRSSVTFSSSQSLLIGSYGIHLISAFD